jgi:hypothetical protein
MTIAQLRTAVQNNWPSGLATDLGITVVNGGILDGWLNDMQRRTCRTFNFSWMKQQVYRSTTTLTDKYALPTAEDSNWTDVDAATVKRFKNEVSCWLKNYNDYRKQLLRRFKTSIEEDGYFDNTVGYGIPTCYYVDADYLKLFKLPDHSYNNDEAFVIYLLFYGYLADLSDSNISNIITANFPELLEYGATAMGFRFANDIEMSDYWMAQAKEIFTEMVQADQIAEHAGVEEGMQPAFGQALGGQAREPARFWQSTDWYNG